MCARSNRLAQPGMREANSLVQIVVVGGGVSIDILAGSEQLARVLLSMGGMMWPCSLSLCDVQALMTSGAAPESKHVPTLVGSQLLAGDGRTQ